MDGIKSYYAVECTVTANCKSDDEAIAMVADACKLYGLEFKWHTTWLDEQERESNATQ
jgi:hypothetical protein